jgi:hypothetical protein
MHFLLPEFLSKRESALASRTCEPCVSVNSAKQLEIRKSGLPAFAEFPVLLKSGEKHMFDLIFWYFFIKKKVQINLIYNNIIN